MPQPQITEYDLVVANGFSLDMITHGIIMDMILAVAVAMCMDDTSVQLSNLQGLSILQREFALLQQLIVPTSPHQSPPPAP